MKPTFGQKLAKVLTYLILILGAAFILLPFVWMILTSVKPSNEVLKMPPSGSPPPSSGRTMHRPSKPFPSSPT